MTSHPHNEIMQRVHDAIKEIVPGQPFTCIVTFPAEKESTDICTTANMPRHHQRELLTIVLDGMDPIPQDTLAN
jgi:hypothetical protein